MNSIELLQEDADIWDLYTRKEEYNPVIRDKYKRFPFFASIAGDIFAPRASEFLTARGFAAEYPKKAPFAVCLTHDIDWIYQERWRKALAVFQSVKSLKIRQVLKNLAQCRSRKLPYCNLREIAELEERYGASSTFYFLALEKHDPRFNYDPADLTGEFEYLREKGAEIGLHGGCSAYNRPEVLAGEKQRLERALGSPVTGYRNHFLRFSTPDTWEILKNAGFRHDSTLGYPDCVGFRNGMCHPFRPYNLHTGTVIDILEFPLVIHDTTLFDYMRLDPQEAWNLTKDLITITEKNHGVITILWHNLAFLSAPQAQFYEKILEYCKMRGAWMTNAGEIAAYWKDTVGW
jgi:peptidoglycan/xylan/chitin deacetylase (PgdA/CDA1 family)